MFKRKECIFNDSDKTRSNRPKKGRRIRMSVQETQCVTNESERHLHAISGLAKPELESAKLPKGSIENA